MKLYVPMLLGALLLSNLGPRSLAATQQLTVTVAGSGTVNRNPTNTVVPQGAVVTLTAVPATNWVFDFWSGDASGTANPINVVMDRDKTITANFSELPTYSLTVNVLGEGAVTPQSGTYPSNTSVTLIATPAEGWVFSGWTGSATGNANPLSITMTENKTITALFLQRPTIVSHPQNFSTGPGGTATFAVSATGSPPLSYEWQFNGSVIANASTDELVIPNVQPADAGSYRVIVANAVGSVTSLVAVLSVTNQCGGGSNVVTACTESEVRQAIARGGIVEFCCGGTIHITGGISVERDVELRGGEIPVLLSGGNLTVSPNVTCILSNVWVVNNRGGSAIVNRGVLRVLSCVLSNNSVGSVTNIGSSARGGAVYNQGGTVRLINSLVVSNSAIGGQGTRLSTPATSGGDATGGAVHNEMGSVFINRCTFRANAAHGGGGDPLGPAGGGVGAGGAIYNGGTLDVRDSTFVQNAAAGGATSRTGANGHGGALYTSGTAYLNGTTFDNNTARGGSGRGRIPLGTEPGGDGNGGAIYNTMALAATNCTLALNRAEAGGTGGDTTMPSSFAQGGALFNSGTLEVMNVTIASNIVVQGRLSPLPRGANVANASGTLRLRNSVVAHGLADLTNSSAVTWTNASGAITDGGFNISSDGSCDFNSGSSFNFTDPKLDSLQENGGPTRTMQPLLGSPALDFGTADGAPPVDQRGATRPFGSGVDIGAVEVSPIAPALTLQSNGSMVILSFYAESGVTYELWSSTDLVTWQLHEAIAAESTSRTVSRSLAASGSQRFFRLQ
jgi:uncharacterized repeat protein (TIGR02543 family)